MRQAANQHLSSSITATTLLMGYLRDRLGKEALYDLIGAARGFPLSAADRASVQAATDPD